MDYQINTDNVSRPTVDNAVGLSSERELIQPLIVKFEEQTQKEILEVLHKRGFLEALSRIDKELRK